jgi:iron complex outermembrane receptor protein
MNHRPLRAAACLLLCGTGATAGIAQAGPPAAPAIGQTPADTGEIVVTAQRRNEKLRDVPISITAINQDTLIKSGINNTIDIQRVTPAVQLPLFGGFLQPVVRGIGSQNSGLGDSSNVAIYVDGVYQPSESGQLIDLPDIQQVEVLKGPQGTLYGQNAAGGAIIFSSVTPRFDLGGRLSASYGNFNDKAVRGYVTGPLVDDKVAFSVAGSYEDRDGFRKSLTFGGHDSGLNAKLVRGRLLVKPSADSQLIFTGYYSERADGGIYAGQPIGPGTPTGYYYAAAEGLTIPTATRPDESALNVKPLTKFTTYGFNMLGKFDTDIGTFSTVTAYNNVKVHDVVDADYTAANVGTVDLTVKNRSFIQEVNFTSRKFGRLSWSAGLFFMALKESYAPNVFDLDSFGPGVTPTTVYPTPGVTLYEISQRAYNKKRSYAAYVEFAYDITDTLSLTAGARYAYETQQTADNHSVLLGPATGGLVPDPRGRIPFRRATPRATLRYALTGSSNIYASYSQGFKSGYVDSGTTLTPPYTPPVKPEIVTAYEVGYKGRIIPGVSVNIAGFYYDYKDIQVYVYGVPTQLYLNAAAAHIKGIDGDITVNLARGLTFSGGAAYVDGKYTRFDDAVVYQANTAPPFGYTQVPYDASGKSLIRSPKWTANAALNYEVETGAGTLGAYVAGNYNSGLNYDVAGIIRQKRYALLDAELSFKPNFLKGLRLVVWGRNLTDKAYIQSVLTSSFVQGASYADPRTFGVRGEFAF